MAIDRIEVWREIVDGWEIAISAKVHVGGIVFPFTREGKEIKKWDPWRDDGQRIDPYYPKDSFWIPKADYIQMMKRVGAIFHQKRRPSNKRSAQGQLFTRGADLS